MQRGNDRCADRKDERADEWHELQDAPENTKQDGVTSSGEGAAVPKETHTHRLARSGSPRC